MALHFALFEARDRDAVFACRKFHKIFKKRPKIQSLLVKISINTVVASQKPKHKQNIRLMLSLAERSAEPSAKLGSMAGLLGRQFENENNYIILDQFQKILHAIVK